MTKRREAYSNEIFAIYKMSLAIFYVFVFVCVRYQFTATSHPGPQLSTCVHGVELC
jgi:hypothetical protein